MLPYRASDLVPERVTSTVACVAASDRLRLSDTAGSKLGPCMREAAGRKRGKVAHGFLTLRSSHATLRYFAPEARAMKKSGIGATNVSGVCLLSKAAKSLPTIDAICDRVQSVASSNCSAQGSHTGLSAAPCFGALNLL